MARSLRELIELAVWPDADAFAEARASVSDPVGVRDLLLENLYGHDEECALRCLNPCCRTLHFCEACEAHAKEDADGR